MSTATLEQIEQVDQIIQKTTGWSHETFTLLRKRLDIAEHPGEDVTLTDEWKKTLATRNEELKTGKVKGLTLEETSAHVRQALGI